MYLRGGEGLGLGQFNANLNIKSEYQKRSLAVTVTGRLPCYTIELESDKQMLKDRARYELPSGEIDYFSISFAGNACSSKLASVQTAEKERREGYARRKLVEGSKEA